MGRWVGSGGGAYYRPPDIVCRKALSFTDDVSGNALRFTAVLSFFLLTLSLENRPARS